MLRHCQFDSKGSDNAPSLSVRRRPRPSPYGVSRLPTSSKRTPAHSKSHPSLLGHRPVNHKRRLAHSRICPCFAKKGGAQNVFGEYARTTNLISHEPKRRSFRCRNSRDARRSRTPCHQRHFWCVGIARSSSDRECRFRLLPSLLALANRHGGVGADREIAADSFFSFCKAESGHQRDIPS
jgi:hypothetical protein